MKLDIAIIDDCLTDTETLSNALAKYEEFFSFSIDIFTDVNLDLLFQKKYDFYFIDIELNGKNGIEIAQNIELLYQNATLFFFSNQDNLVFETFIVNTLYFIRKTHLSLDLDKALNKVLRKNSFTRTFYQFPIHNIPLNRILYIETLRNYILIHLSNGEQIIERIPFKKIKQEFLANNFMHIYHGIIVNMHYIKKIEKNLQIIVLINTTQLPISNRRYKSTYDNYMNFLINQQK